ncbi:MAG: hypothetical protein ACOX8W_02675 [bacterium]
MNRNTVDSCSTCRNLDACSRYIPKSFTEYHLMRLAAICRNSKRCSVYDRVAAEGVRPVDRLTAEDMVREGLARWTPEGVLAPAGLHR